MIATNEFKKGLRVEVNGEPYVIVDFEHVKPGKGAAFTRTKLKNLVSGSVLEKTLKSGEVLPEADVSFVDYEYLYQEAGKFVLMNTSTYEQLELNAPWMRQKSLYLKEHMKVKVNFFKDKPFDVTFPNFVELKVTYCEPGVKGDSATSSTKPAELETGLKVQVPLHVKTGDVLKIDTRDGQYVEKVK
jgi:elongation factor P